ncbi:MAG: efflux RND transporter periplasmic adaptor subunit [Planctomycetes bacterium]|nr:efflux RND transporter periplasmic adaptor subunit [Planctomycetota bacterium]
MAHIEGEHLDAEHQEVFRIVNAEHVWVAGNISEFDLARLADAPGASVVLPAFADRRFDIHRDGGRLVNIGKVVDPRTRTVSVIYELPNREGLLRIGMFADVHVESRKAVDALALPEEAVVMDNGRPVAFVLLDGERFQRRDLELGLRDAGFIEACSGVASGERVVIRGAYAVRLASQSPASFGAGHVH